MATSHIWLIAMIASSAFSWLSATMSKKPRQPQDKYIIRLPTGLRDRIALAAKKQGRSMNAEIVRVLDHEFPEPFPVEDVVHDIKRHVDFLRQIKGYTSLDVLADSIDHLLLDISRDDAAPQATRDAVRDFIEKHGIFDRAPRPPSDDD